MDLLNRIVKEMNKDEIRYFKVYSTRITGYEGRKDLQLFDIIRQKGEEYNEKVAMKKISGENRNAFYRLKNRLINDINDFMALHNFDASPATALNRDWALFNTYLGKRNFDLAYVYLKRAEKKAIAAENFDMLDIVYSQMVRISSEVLMDNPEKYIQLQKQNTEKLLLLREIDRVLAVLTHRIRVTQNWAPENPVLTRLLEKTIKEFSNSQKMLNSSVFQTRLYQAVSQVLLQRHRYDELLKFVSTTYENFRKNNWFNKANHELKLKMLTYIVNSAFRLQQFSVSLEYAQVLGSELDAYNAFLKEQFLFFYYNSLTLNYMKLDLKKALAVIEQMEQEMRKRKISYYDQFIYLNKAITLNWLNKPDLAIRNLVKLYVLDSFKQTDESFRFRIAIAELIMQLDAGDKKSFNMRLGQLRHDFKELLENEGFKSEKELLTILELVNSTEKFLEDKKLYARVKKFLKIIGTKEDERAGIINYREWFEKKYEGSPVVA